MLNAALPLPLFQKISRGSPKDGAFFDAPLVQAQWTRPPLRPRHAHPLNDLDVGLFSVFQKRRQAVVG